MTQQVAPLNMGTPIVDGNGFPSEQFLKQWQQLVAQGNYAAGALMPTPAPVIIRTDYTGTPLTNELPRVISASRYLYGNDVSTRTRWFLTVKSGNITASIDQNGIITITAAGAGGVLTLKSVRDNITLIENFLVTVTTGAPPTVGAAGGGSTSVTTFTGTSAITMASISTDVVVTVGSGGIANLQATLSVDTAATSPRATYAVYGIWRWWNGAAYVDVSTEVISNPHCSVDQDSTGIRPIMYIYTENTGSLSVASSKTGLVAGSSHRFQVFARNNSGTRAMSYSGSATATGA